MLNSTYTMIDISLKIRWRKS